MKELEALENIAKNVEGNDEYRFEHYKHDYNLIKSALERKEKLEKVWKIVKDKQVDILQLKECILEEGENALTVYNKYCAHPELTEAEFNLLKEMLEEK